MGNEQEFFKDEYIENILSEKEAKDFSKIQRDFLESYAFAKDTMSIEEWLFKEFQEYFPQKNKEEVQEMSSEIIDSLKITEGMKVSQEKAINSGRSKESWLASTLLRSTSRMSAQESMKYLKELDTAIKNANKAMLNTVTTKSGLPNQNMNLDGFIAEQYHVNSYNLQAKAKGGGLHAEVLNPKPGQTYAKNSVDILLKDAKGKTVSRYQAKYGATAEDTIRMIKQGDYRGQQLLVPEEQVEAVKKAFPGRKVSSTIGDKSISSRPLSKGRAKELQEKAQTGNDLNMNWSEYATKDIALGIGKQAGVACLQGAAVSAGMTIATKVCQGESIESEEVIRVAINSGSDFGVKTAVAGALKIAVEKDIVRCIPKGANGNVFANIAFVAVENVKVFGKVASGKLTVKEGIDVAQQTTGACIAGLMASAKGAAIGAQIGTILGPVGMVVGGFVGGTIGYMAGSKVGETIIKGGQMLRDATKNIARSFSSGVQSCFSKVGSWLFG